MPTPELVPAPARPASMEGGPSLWPVPGPRTARAEGGKRFVPGRPLLMTILLAFLGALLLQCWRPCFFLTGDTISAWLGPSTEFYRRLWEGQAPFYDPYLFGGFDLREDLGVFTVLSPWALPFSFLAKTPYYFLIPEIVGTGSLVTAAGAFCWSALRLRRHLALPIPPGLIVALSLSYAFTPFNFLFGASWIGFLSAPAAFPLILAGACERDWRKALAIQTAAVAYALFGGHMHPFMMMGLFATATVALLAAVQRRWQTVAVWMAAGALPLLCALPLLWPSMVAFQQTSRAAEGLSLHEASQYSVPAEQLVASFFGGTASRHFLDGMRIDVARPVYDPVYNLAIAFALVNVPLLVLLCFKGRRWHAVEVCVLMLLLVSVLCIVRPPWLANVFAHLPLLRALRWPYREITVLNFFAHALFLLAFRPPQNRPARLGVFGGGLVGAVVYLKVFFCVAPTLWLFEPDRQLIMSGEADHYWNVIKAHGGPGAGDGRFVAGAFRQTLGTPRAAVPFSLIGGFNYPALFRVRNVSGFSVTPPPSADWLERDTGTVPYFCGVFSPAAVQRIRAVYPDIQAVMLTSAVPATWETFDGQTRRAFLYDPHSGLVQFRPVVRVPPTP